MKVSEALGYATLSTVLEYLRGETTVEDIAADTGCDIDEVKDWLEYSIEPERDNAEILLSRFTRRELLECESRFSRRMKLMPEFSAIAIHIAVHGV